ncbi:hypothetical protein [Rhizobium beringeri]|uniref:hypothetical protein n=1 Tax=Rhizobium beringeri TaxID=3019934 RepID=UPI003B5C398D
MANSVPPAFVRVVAAASVSDHRPVGSTDITTRTFEGDAPNAFSLSLKMRMLRFCRQ